MQPFNVGRPLNRGLINNYLSLTIHTTRNSGPSNFKVNVQHKQNYFQFSFFPRTVNLWNSLPKDIKTLNFQSKLAEYSPFTSKVASSSPNSVFSM